MANSDLVRFSRDGDQFHYVWAARRCLRLLLPSPNLVAVSIEGASTSEMQPDKQIVDGDETIDVAEYYGSEEIELASCVVYIQLKHSTQRSSIPWTASDLETTVEGFAKRYTAFVGRFGSEAVAAKFQFKLVTNRPIAASLTETIDDLLRNVNTRHPRVKEVLEKATSLVGEELASFLKLLCLEGGKDGLWDQRNLLEVDTSCYLPDADVDAPVQLKELVTEKALSKNSATRSISRTDVLRALKTDGPHLYPSPCLIKGVDGAVPRAQEAELIGEIVRAAGRPIIISADAGVGKSVFSVQIGKGLPTGSVCVVYDCFGDGQYRNPSSFRHRPKDGLVQIANELAAHSLCHPLIPTRHAEPAAYSKAFIYRLRQAITLLRAENSDALLCIVVDAADNAEMAARERQDGHSFIRDLLRERLPDGVCLVAFCRPHRKLLLEPAPGTVEQSLLPFCRNETAMHLRRHFPDASEADIDEFHRLSSQNPRVQATALARGLTLPETLRALGPNPTSVDDILQNLLEHAVAELRDKGGPTEGGQVDKICAGLAVLRPLVPIPVLAKLSDVDESAVRSFALEFGRPLVVIGDTIQFFDEPAETWFRERFKPPPDKMADFLRLLEPAATDSAYVTSVLPQLLVEAGRLDTLVNLALSSAGLPGNSPIERRDVEVQRLQFALAATLKSKRYLDAAKLAQKAAVEAAGEGRQQKLIQANTDLASTLLDVDRIQEIVSRRAFSSAWIGSHHAYEAGLMSGCVELRGDARSRLRMAYEWLRNWSRRTSQQRDRERITDNDIAEIALAQLNLHGANACVGELERWKPRSIPFRVGSIVARRLVDHSRYGELDQLAEAARKDGYLLLAIVNELRAVYRSPPTSVLSWALQLVRDPRFHVKEEEADAWDYKRTALGALTTLVEVAITEGVGSSDELAALLVRYLPATPPRALSSRFDGARTHYLRSYALLALLTGKPIQINDLAYPELREVLEKQEQGSETSESREFLATIGRLLPWYTLWAQALTNHGQTESLEAAIADAQAQSSQARHSYQDDNWVSDEIAWVRFNILIASRLISQTGGASSFDDWLSSLKSPLSTVTLTRMTRLAARVGGLEELSLQYAGRVYDQTRRERLHAETEADAYVDLARAILAVSKDEASVYFNCAVEVSSKIGDENIDRWTSILDLADRSAGEDVRGSELAYKLSRCSELTYAYVARDKHFDWEATVTAITGLSASSAFAILSRWRDRDFGDRGRLLPVVAGRLLASGQLDPRVGTALRYFRGRWRDDEILREALDRCRDPVVKGQVASAVIQIARLEGRSATQWQSIKDVVSRHQVQFPDADALIQAAQTKEGRESRATSQSHLPSWQEGKEVDWEAVFFGIDIGSPSGLTDAYSRFRLTPIPRHHEHFFRELFRRTKAGKEAQFLRAFSDVPEFDLYDFRHLLQAYPEGWKSRRSAQQALANVLRKMCVRYCLQIAKTRYYESFPLDEACKLTGLDEAELVELILASIGQSSEIYDAARLFALTSLITFRLSTSAAREALSFGLSLFDELLEEKDGDGDWSPALVPPASVSDAVAGYVWAALAAPESYVRWEAAHVVRALCTLEVKPVVGNIVGRIGSSSGGPFADHGLKFYDLHARQWLLIALARAAIEAPAVVAPILRRC